MGACEVRAVNPAAALRVMPGIEPEQQLDDLAPVGAIAFGIDESQVKHHMLVVVRGQRIAVGRRIQKLRRRLVHQRALLAGIAAIDQIELDTER